MKFKYILANLGVFRVAFDKVHEMVQVGVGRLRRVGQVGLLH
jgi:hypothetical protein